MYKMNSLDDLARQRAIAPQPLLGGALDAARGFVRWWGAHRAWPASEPARICAPVCGRP